MSGFIISKTSEPDRFLAYDRTNKLFITNRKEKAALFPDTGRAWRVINNQVPKKKRGGWGVIAYEPEVVTPPQENKRYKAGIDTSVVKDEEKIDWEDIKSNLSKIYSEIINYKKELATKLNKVDLELCDLEHYCEFFKCDAANGYKLYAMIRERRIARRFYKNELKKAGIILELTPQEIADGKYEKTFNEIENQTYEPRALKEMFSNLTDSSLAQH